MAIDRGELRWNGWGRKALGVALSERQRQAVLARLSAELGLPRAAPTAAVELERAVLPASRLAEPVRTALERALGASQVLLDQASRAQHAAGKSLPDLLRLRTGRLERAPDAVLYPRDEDDVARVLALARDHALAVVPFGGGTSVVGGVEPICAANQRAVIALDVTRLDRLVALDADSMTATFQAGIDGPRLERELEARGYTLGHFPQSFEHSTLGGWIAARSSGQQSDGYGGIDALLVSAKLLTPRGELCTLTVPRSATGPDLNQVVLGSEGTLGVIVEATLRIRKKRAHHRVHGMLFRDFAAGVRALRAWLDADLGLGMMRLSDAQETALSLLLRQDPERRIDPTVLFFGAMRALGYRDDRALMLFGAEGDDQSELSSRLLKAQTIGVSHGGLPLGKSPGEAWKKDRFRAPYLRDFLLDHGLAIDTMETAFPWSKLEAGHASVVEAMRRAALEHAGAGFAMGHVSHSYADGACVYFIVLYPLARGDVLAQWRAIKRATTDAIVAAGGTLSHHHGVGLDHAAWFAREKGELGVDAVRALKRALDPDDIMNPGKLL